ncbi:MAG: hypothetical protein GY822_28675 [Deltaproteobacteria bacterium]|nr:hypothetical protein [Deltaproteobacteria bacterium]
MNEAYWTNLAQRIEAVPGWCLGPIFPNAVEGRAKTLAELRKRLGDNETRSAQTLISLGERSNELFGAYLESMLVPNHHAMFGVARGLVETFGTTWKLDVDKDKRNQVLETSQRT